MLLSNAEFITHNSAKLIISGAFYRPKQLNRGFLLMTSQTQAHLKETLIRRMRC